uniref:Lipocalin n=1 Tax=Rhipicephalus appendiculatus TaxID=34631 RepID=A0A131Z6S4_RHIAP
MVAAMRTCGAFRFAVLLTLLHSGHSYTKHYEDISRFYSLREEIRTVYTTLGETECKVDAVTDAYSQRAEFNRTFDLQAKKSPIDLVGKFINERYALRSVDLDAMEVRRKSDGHFYSFERLFHAFDDYKCGIFFVSKKTNRGGNDYELRVKGVHNPGKICMEKFKWYRQRSFKTTHAHCGKMR